jgi:hypothetical protein
MCQKATLPARIDRERVPQLQRHRKEVMSWLKYVWAILIGFAAMTIFTVSTASLILWLTTSRVVAHNCANMPIKPNDCGGWTALGYEIMVLAGCAFVGLFIGSAVGTMVGISFYRRNQRTNPTIVN